jgi:two-component system sensor histidine kinase FlrB
MSAGPLHKNTHDSQGIEREGLEVAFRDFSAISSQLIDSYQLLQGQVADLEGELSKSNQERVQVGRDRENLANRLEHLLDFLPGGVVVIDSRGLVEDCNSVAMDFLGKAIIGKYWSEIIDQNFSPKFDDGHEISLKDGRRLSIATRSLSEKFSNCDNKSQNTFLKRGQIVLLTDQTQTRDLQDRLSRHKRLSTMGKMVAYLAHQIRTPLSSAMLYGSHLNNPDLSTEQRTSFSEKLLRQLRNIERQVSDLLIFARGEQSTQTKITAEAFFYLLKRDLDASVILDGINVDVILDADAKARSFVCNSPSLISAILNLVNNAKEAGIENQQKMPIEILVNAHLRDENLIINVCDNGPGISESQLHKVLEPFYSTKSKGTGLGLAVVQAVIKSLSGSLHIRTINTGGLKIELVIPLLPL